MHRSGIAYVELYVADDKAVVDYYTRGLMFDQVAVARDRERRSTLLCSNDVQVVITAPTGGDGPVADYLARHGDGVADIALYHDDISALVTRAHDAGFTVLKRPSEGSGTWTARVAGAGTVRHTLVGAASHLLGRLPAGFAWESEQIMFPAPAKSRAALVRPQAIDHLAWCLPAESLETVTVQYREALGMEIIGSEQITVGTSVANSYVLAGAGVTFVLAAPDRRQQPEPGGQIDEFLDAHASAGVQHIAWRTSDIVTAVRLHSCGGVEFLPTPSAYYDRLPAQLTDLPPVCARLEELRSTGVLVDHDGPGLLYQIFTRSPHQRGALFYEIIQRDGSAGFGTRNVRALFEARERSGASPSASADRGL